MPFARFKLATTILSGFCAFLASQSMVRADETITLTESPGWPTYQTSAVDRNLRWQDERFFVHVPPGVSSSRSVGLLVFVPAEDTFTGLPAGWAEVLDRNQFVFIAPQNAGNNQTSARRAGLGVMAAMGMLKKYRNIDTRRVFVSGFSGGARTASNIAFAQADLFRGALLNCGSNFPARITWHSAGSEGNKDDNYGYCSATPQECQWAKSYVRFAIVTGGDDFRRPYLQDIYDDGFRRGGYQARLFDVPDLGHNLCDGRTLQQALDFLSTGR